MDILEKPSYISNEEMLNRCLLLKKVLDAKIEKKVGRGKTTQTIQVNKYDTKTLHYKRIVNSCEYYQNKYDMETSSGVTFRDYQLDIIEQGTAILQASGFLYLAMEVRTGKTLTSLGIARNIDAKNILFITKKKAISSIQSDYNMLSCPFDIQIINYESLHLVADNEQWDLIICDEAHSMGAFPKPSNRAVAVKDLLKKYKSKVILLSGTPTPESYCQMYHQVYGIKGNPFSEYKNFYRFCDDYVNVKERKINGLIIKDYSGGNTSILDEMRPYTINYTQAEAGFLSKVNETVLQVELQPKTYEIMLKLKRDLVIQGKDETILADTPVKLLSKVHQLCSGTIKFESGNSMVLDTSKAEFIKEHFKGKKIGIFYKFKEELNALKKVFDDSLTTELDAFNATDKNIALQIVSGREGISLKAADCLVFYNIDFSATSYWQSKDRMTTKDRLVNDVYWIFAVGGIEFDIYKAVTAKLDYTVSHFKKLLL
jgi:hypothetical protein